MSARTPGSGWRARVLVHLYPPSWRERYGEEYLALLEDVGPGPRAVLNTARGAAGAWMRPSETVLGGALRLRATVSVVWWAWIALAGGLLVFAQMTEDRPFRAADAAHPLLGALYDATVVAAVVSGLAVAAGAIPVALSLWRGARRRRERVTVGLLVVPAVVSAGWLVAVIAIAHLVPHSRTPGVGIGTGWYLVVLALGLVAAAACAAAPTVALRRVDAHRPALRLATAAALPATIAIVFATATAAAYAIALPATAPGLDATVSYPRLLAPWAVLMALAGVVAVTSSMRGVRVLRRPG